MKTKIFFSGLILLSLIMIQSCKKDKNKDTTPPVITVNPPNPYTVNKDSAYVDPGATALDETDGDISSKIVTTNNVNVHDTGYYQVKYNVSDNSGNAAVEKVRNVHVMVF